MPKRLAITIAGAVSLGSYEAGVLYEVLDAIRQHNQNSQTTEADAICVDVITGASAGGMTAIILAQKLLYSGHEFQGPYDNPLYETWVRRITLQDLQDNQEDEPALHSLFSSNLIETISREALLNRYSRCAPLNRVPHAAAASSLRIGVALTNLNGVNYGYDTVPPDRFSYIDYCDQLTRFIEPENSDTAKFWEPLRQAAVASGAFPFAFRTQDIERSANNEPADYLPDNLEPWTRDPLTFTYTDGGVLQNQPLGMAKNLVDLIDFHLHQDSRFYLFVSPHAKDAEANDAFHEKNADYFHLLRRLASVIVGQSGFQDWITAREVNQRLQLLNERAEGLRDAIKNVSIDVPCLQQTAASILALFFPGGVQKSPGSRGPETLDQAKARIDSQFSEWIAELGANSPAALAYRDSVLAFETAAGLGARDQMTIYGITAKERELAGGGLEAFLGFFDQRFRDHDYDVGRSHAQRFLANPGELGPIRHIPNTIRAIDSRLDGLKLSHVPHADLVAFKAGLRKRLNQMLKELWGPISFAAIPGSDLILDSLLDRMIAKL